MPVAVFVPTRIPGLWGGWQYQLSGLEASADAFNFGYGGYQEARGCVLFEQRALSAHPDARARWQGASLTTLAPFFLPAAYRSRPLLRPLCSLAAPSLPSSGIKNNHFYIENIFEELDAPGEWWFNRSSSELFFMPNGTLQNSTVVAVPVLETLIAINGTAESPAKVCANSGRRDSKRRRHRRVRSRPPSPPPLRRCARTLCGRAWLSPRRKARFCSSTRSRRAATGPSTAAAPFSWRMPRPLQ